MSFPKKVRDLVEARSDGVCEGCYTARATEVHHRQFKSRGGKDTVQNALHLCGWGNHSGCHGIAHSGREGERLGWAVRSGDDPQYIPVRDMLGHQWWLAPDGRKVRHDDHNIPF